MLFWWGNFFFLRGPRRLPDIPPGATLIGTVIAVGGLFWSSFASGLAERLSRGASQMGFGALSVAFAGPLLSRYHLSIEGTCGRG